MGGRRKLLVYNFVRGQIRPIPAYREPRKLGRQIAAGRPKKSIEVSHVPARQTCHARGRVFGQPGMG
jgi:hypothetical protein